MMGRVKTGKFYTGTAQGTIYNIEQTSDDVALIWDDGRDKTKAVTWSVDDVLRNFTNGNWTYVNEPTSEVATTKTCRCEISVLMNAGCLSNHGQPCPSI